MKKSNIVLTIIVVAICVGIIALLMTHGTVGISVAIDCHSTNGLDQVTQFKNEVTAMVSHDFNMYPAPQDGCKNYPLYEASAVIYAHNIIQAYTYQAGVNRIAHETGVTVSTNVIPATIGTIFYPTP